ncbi:hypothetical protein BD560DRAFT_395512 [Blakeslea trispora]|nr:hypothetical protein BD560DRAFT_395512 [Blakeslea trispora]
MHPTYQYRAYNTFMFLPSYKQLHFMSFSFCLFVSTFLLHFLALFQPVVPTIVQ